MSMWVWVQQAQVQLVVAVIMAVAVMGDARHRMYGVCGCGTTTVVLCPVRHWALETARPQTGDEDDEDRGVYVCCFWGTQFIATNSSPPPPPV